MTSSPVAEDAGCPKRMVFGPCGGVRPGGACEMRPGACVFGELVRWPAPPVPVQQATPWTAPVILTDLSVPPADAATLRAVAQVLVPACDAVLVGDHQDRADFAPSRLAELLRDAGTTPWVTLACRDRNRFQLEQELELLRRGSPVTVLCVTGDGRAFDVRPDRAQVFDLDGTRLAALAGSMGLDVAVAESPQSPPTALRPERLVQKQLAGARVGVLNATRSPQAVADFLAAARGAGLTMPVIAAVPVYTDDLSAAVLTALPGLELDSAAVRSVLAATDPVSAGIATATALALQLLAVPGVAGVNLSGLASARSPLFAAQVQAQIGRSIREQRPRVSAAAPPGAAAGHAPDAT